MFSDITKNKTYFIAEIGSNFDGSLSRAKHLIRLASQCGANAAKFQHYTAETLISSNGFERLRNNSHQAAWPMPVFETYDKASLDISWTEELHLCCKENNIDFLTSAYSPQLLADTIDYVPFIKIGSGDISDTEYLAYASSFNKPIALATGASSMDDVARAVEAIGTDVPICLMQCNTNYENNSKDAIYQNLSVLTTYKYHWPNVSLGLSCHIKSDLSVIIGVALGASIIEKHFTDDDLRNGPDHRFALTPSEFTAMVHRVRLAEDMLGDGVKRVEENELGAFPAQRRGIAASRNLPSGHLLSREDLVFLRPYIDSSFHPYEIHRLLGKRLVHSLKRFQTLLQSDVQDIC